MAKTILLVVPAAGFDESVRDAAAFCEKAGAHLSVLIASFAPPVPIGEYGLAISDAWAKEQQADHRHAAPPHAHEEQREITGCGDREGLADHEVDFQRLHQCA